MCVCVCVCDGGGVRGGGGGAVVGVTPSPPQRTASIITMGALPAHFRCFTHCGWMVRKPEP